MRATIFIAVVLTHFPFGDSHLLDNIPLVDGHNDLAYNLLKLELNNLSNINLGRDLSNDSKWGLESCETCYTDFVRLKSGKIGAQFWSAYTPCESQYRDAVARTLEQIDVIRRFISKYPQYLQWATDSDGIKKAYAAGKVASLIGVEGGHSIDSRASVLRMYYELGVRYMTLTHMCNTPWSDASPVDMGLPVHNLTEFGMKLIREMNRLGMLIDLSHVSRNVMNQALIASSAPVIFSHSSAWQVTHHHRNVHDDTLQLLRNNGGIIMVNFYSGYVSSNPENATIQDVIDHINHIVNVTGMNHIGIGGDYDGFDMVPIGLEDVSKYADLFDALANDNATRWTDNNLKKLAGNNFLRVFQTVEEIKMSLINEEPMQDWISIDELYRDLSPKEACAVAMCRTYVGTPLVDSAKELNDQLSCYSGAAGIYANIALLLLSAYFIAH